MSYLIALAVFLFLMFAPLMFGAWMEERATAREAREGRCECGKGFVPPF